MLALLLYKFFSGYFLGGGLGNGFLLAWKIPCGACLLQVVKILAMVSPVMFASYSSTSSLSLADVVIWPLLLICRQAQK